MILASFGSPSAISYAVTDIVRRLMADGVGGDTLFQVADIADFRMQWREAPVEARRAVLVASDCPRPCIVTLFAATSGPILVCCDRFDGIVRYNMRSRGMGFGAAARFATQVLSVLDALTRAPNVMRITPTQGDRDLAGFAHGLASFLGIPLTSRQVESVMTNLGVTGGRESDRLRQFVASRFPNSHDDRDDPVALPADRAVLSQLAEGYGPLVDGHGLDRVSWPTALFLDWSRPGHELEGPLALVGPARFLICGPYLHLPGGCWRMSVTIETQDCLSDNRIGADVFAQRILSAVSMQLPASGRYVFDLDFEVSDPFLPLELRVQLLTGAIEGSLRLLDVTLTRRAGEAAAAEQPAPVPALEAA